ncbi:E3 ubiquitin-protein ligase FANCL [Amphibalanus amphitrite]|uniref:E3 ubiquitin-protein ligase FANCL n=1 Tax=Amphibalanus amphitrite TaxID=1232801 RepID=A0A6A4W0R4_AMPAM|nr:E3 ubiquitin-protein ligase FANCL [Amphibalanus amphitrite]
MDEPSLFSEFPFLVRLRSTGGMVLKGHLVAGGSTLLDIYQRFEEAVDKYQDFWTALDRLDAQLWVVDPESPSRRDTRRRIVISSQLSLEVTVDPLYPSSVPGCRFLGAETAAAALRDKLAREIDVS